MRWWLFTIAPSFDIAALLRSVGFQAAQPQVTDEGITCCPNLLGKVTSFPLIRQFSRWSNCHLPRIAASPRGKAFGSALPSNVPRLCSFPYEGRRLLAVRSRAMRRASVPSPTEGKVDRGGETYPRWMRWQRVNTLSPSSFSQIFSFFTAQREKLLTKLTIRAILHNSRQGLRPRINPRRRNAGGSV